MFNNYSEQQLVNYNAYIRTYACMKFHFWLKMIGNEVLCHKKESADVRLINWRS